MATVHLYAETGNTWAEIDELAADDGAPGDFFALGMDFDGQSLIVGEPATNSVSPHSAAYVFAKGVPDFAQQAKLENGATISGAVAISGDTAVVGTTAAGGGDGQVTMNARSVYVFRRTGQVWTQTQQLAAPAAMTGPSALSVNGGTLAVGVSDDTLVGAVQVFRDPSEDAPASAASGSNKKSGTAERS